MKPRKTSPLPPSPSKCSLSPTLALVVHVASAGPLAFGNGRNDGANDAGSNTERVQRITLAQFVKSGSIRASEARPREKRDSRADADDPDTASERTGEAEADREKQTSTMQVRKDQQAPRCNSELGNSPQVARGADQTTENTVDLRVDVREERVGGTVGGVHEECDQSDAQDHDGGAVRVHESHPKGHHTLTDSESSVEV
jgi:hypothetical protein